MMNTPPPAWLERLGIVAGVITVVLVLGMFGLFAMAHVALNGAPL